MSRESAIEAIEKKIDNYIFSGLLPGQDFKRFISMVLFDEDFVHLDDIAEGWHTSLEGKRPQYTGIDWRANPPKLIGDDTRPATIREVLSGLAVRKEA